LQNCWHDGLIPEQTGAPTFRRRAKKSFLTRQSLKLPTRDYPRLHSTAVVLEATSSFTLNAKSYLDSDLQKAKLIAKENVFKPYKCCFIKNLFESFKSAFGLHLAKLCFSRMLTL